MKVGYTTLEGYESTAYLDELEVAPNIYKGEHKHTEKSVWLKSLGENGWIEIDPIMGERERIIKVLEEEKGDWADCICIGHKQELIALIKGEK